jgi:hypothetical protein
MGDINYCVGGTIQEMPEIHWAKVNIGNRTNKHRWNCLGVWVCNEEGCLFRFRPPVPRYGKSKYNTGGKYPEPAEKDICPQHSVGMTHLKCNASWSFSFSVGDENTDPAWKVIHKGLHEHPAPFPIGASKSAKKTLRKYLSVEPNLTASALLKGNDIRRPIHEADIRFGSPDYLRHSLQRERKEVYKYATGHDKAYDSLDTTLEFFRQLHQQHPNVVVNTHMPSKFSEAVGISFQTDEMEELTVDTLCPKQVSTVINLELLDPFYSH